MFTDSDSAMSFVCQRCKQPLKMDESFSALVPSAYDMIASLSDRNNSIFYHHLHNDPNTINSSSSPTRSSVPCQSNVRIAKPSLQGPKSFNLPKALPAIPPTGSPANQPSSYPPQSGFQAGPSESFVVLSESTLGAARAQPTLRDTNNAASAAPQRPSQTPPESSRHQIERLVKLCDLLSNNLSGVEHPLCTECTDILLELMNNQLQAAKSDRDRYAIFERDLNRERGSASAGENSAPDSCEKLRADIKKLQIKESEASQKLKSTETECERIEAELQKLEEEEAELKQEEERFWEDYNHYELDLAEVRSYSESILSRYRQDQIELEKLRQTSVYKDAFCIGCEAGVATINGLRLGRLPEVPVEWVEINAAWGHTALLLQTLCKRINYSLDGYRLIPMGSFSRIERTKGDKASLELFGSDEFALSRVLHNRRFDNAMVDFLECLRQVSEQAIQRNLTTKMPFRIHRDKIGESSIKLSFSSDEAWTSALRHILFTLKIINSALERSSSI